MPFLTFDTEEQFDTWHAEMNELKGYDDGRGTINYTSCFEGSDGLFYAFIHEKDVALLDEMQSAHGSVLTDAEGVAKRPSTEEII